MIDAEADGFSARLDAVAREMGWGSDQQIAQALGVSKTTVFNWRHGINRPYASRLARIEGATGVSREWLATGEGPMRVEPPPGAIGSTLPGGVAIAAGPVMSLEGSALQEATAAYVPIPGPPDRWDVASLVAALDGVERRVGREAPAAQRIGLALDQARLFRQAQRMPALREFHEDLLAASLAAAEGLLPQAGGGDGTTERVTAMLSIYMVMRGEKG